MGTTALTLLQRVATSAGIMKLFVVLSTASLAVCMPAAQLLHPGLAALVPVGTHQWPGITNGAVDKTCFGCRPAVVAAIHGRKRREAEPVAEAEAAAEPHGLLPGFLVHPYLPLHATAVVGSSSYQTVDNNGAKYTTGVTALHPVFIHGRRKEELKLWQNLKLMLLLLLFLFLPPLCMLSMAMPTLSLATAMPPSPLPISTMPSLTIFLCTLSLDKL